MEPVENLPLLRDIHLPQSASPFPPGYGWGVIVGALVLLWLGYRLLKFIKLKSKKYYALRLLADASGNNVRSAREISEILRRICLYKYKNAAALVGRKWVDFLNEHCSQKLAKKTSALLLEAPYVPDDRKYSTDEYVALRQFAARWIGENL